MIADQPSHGLTVRETVENVQNPYRWHSTFLDMCDAPVRGKKKKSHQLASPTRADTYWTTEIIGVDRKGLANEQKKKKRAVQIFTSYSRKRRTRTVKGVGARDDVSAYDLKTHEIFIFTSRVSRR